jgi:DNA-binding transcriptional LysR family regulator
MEIWRLRYFLVVAEELHFGRAAKKLLITQPGLSQQISKLEQELGVRLFERAGGIALTPAGEALQRSASHLMAEMDRVEEEVRAYASGRAGTLSIFLTPPPAPAAFNGMLNSFRRDYPGVDIRIQTAWTNWNLKAVESGEIDLALVLLPVDGHKDLEFVEVSHEAPSVALPVAHPLASAEEVTPESLLDLPFFFWPREQAPGAYDRILRYLSLHGKRAVDRYEPDPIRLASAVGEGNGFTIAIRSRGEAMQFPGVVWRPLPDDAPKFRHGLCWRHETGSATTRHFLEYVGQNLLSPDG